MLNNVNECLWRQREMYSQVRQQWCGGDSALIWNPDLERHDDVNISLVVPLDLSLSNDLIRPLKDLRDGCDSLGENHRWRAPKDLYITLNALPRAEIYVDVKIDNLWRESFAKIRETCKSMSPFILDFVGMNILSDALIVQVFSPDDKLHILHNAIFQSGIGSRRAEFEGPGGPNGYVPHLKVANILTRPNELAKMANNANYCELPLATIEVDALEIRRRVRTPTSSDYSVVEKITLGMTVTN